MINYTNKYNFAILKYNRKFNHQFYSENIAFSWNSSTSFGILIFKKLLMIYLHIESQDSETRGKNKLYCVLCFMWEYTKAANQKILLHSLVIYKWMFWFTIE